jgi:hypothetical protein
MGAADSVSVPGLAVDVFASVAINGFITDDSNPAFWAKPVDDKASNDLGQSPGGSFPVGEQSMKRRGVERLDEL